MFHSQIQCICGGIDDLCKLGKDYLTALIMHIMHFVLDEIRKVLTNCMPFYQ